MHHSEHLNPTDPEYKVTYNFKYLDQGVEMPSGRFSAVQAMIKYRRERLLLHPLTLKFNEVKWSKLGRSVFMFDFVTYLILMILFTIFIVDQRKGQDFREVDNQPKNSAQRDPKRKPSDFYKKDTLFTEMVPIMILLFAVVHMCKEFLQIYVQRWNYFKDLSNYLDWTLHICAALFMIPYVTTQQDLDDWFEGMKDPRSLWIIGIVAIFVCYTNMILFLRRYRLFGTYIAMYIEVTKTVFQVMAVFTFLVLGFALVFYILFKEQVGNTGLTCECNVTLRNIDNTTKDICSLIILLLSSTEICLPWLENVLYH